MAWQDEMIPMLRIIINDFSETPDYNDGQLTQVLTVAAKYVSQEISTTNTYVITMGCTIAPDPTELGDDAFVNFVVLKAACLIDQGKLRTAAMSAGIKAVCGHATLDTMGQLSGFKDIINMTACEMYEQLKQDWNFGGGMFNVCRFVLGPYGSENLACGYQLTNSCGTFFPR